MATYGQGGQGSTDQKDKEKESQAGTGSQSFSPSTSGSRMSEFSSGTQGGSGAANSGRFTNLKNYIGANQGAGNQLGERITGGLSREKEKASTQQAQGTQAIADKVNAERERLGQGEKFAEQLGTETGAQNIYGDQGQRDQFGNLLQQQGNYQGINQNLNQTQNQLQTNLNQLGQNVSNLGNEQGRFQLLQSNVKGPNYTTGQQRLDQLFLQTGDPRALQQAQQGLQGDIRGLQTGLNIAVDQFGNDISGLRQQEADVAKLLQDTLTGESSSLYGGARTSAEQLNAQNALLNNAMTQYFSGQGVSDDAQRQALQAELDRNAGLYTSGEKIYNTLADDNLKFANLGSVGNTAQDVMNQNQFNKYNALMDLANLNPANFGLTSEINRDLGFGGATTSGIKGQEFRSAIDAERQALENQLNRTGSGKGSSTIDTRNLFRPDSYSEYAKTDALSQANLLDLLNQYDTNNNTNFNGINTTYSGSEDFGGGGTYTSSGKFSSGGPRPVYTETGKKSISEASNISKQDLINQFLNEINQAGYGNTLSLDKKK